MDQNIHQLDEDSPRAEQPECCKIPLMPHQLALLQRCRDYERGPVVLPDNPNQSFQTMLGIIGDKAGSGKSYVILSLVMDKSTLPLVQTVTTNYSNTRISLAVQKNVPYFPMSVIVIPSHLVEQWKFYLYYFNPELKVFIYSTSTQSFNIEQILETDLIIVTDTQHNFFAECVAVAGITFARTFYDEADSLNIRGRSEISSKFHWFCSSGYKNLQFPYGLYGSSNTHIINKQISKGIRATGCYRDVIIRMSNHERIARALVVRCNDRFVDISISISRIIPKIEEANVICKSTAKLIIQGDNIESNFLRCIYADEMATAITLLDDQNKGTEKEIVTLCIGADNDNKSTDIQSNNKYIRIHNTSTCSICYENIDTKAVLKCCTNAFCIKCISRWVATKKTCPMCKTRVQLDNLLVVLPIHVPPPPKKIMFIMEDEFNFDSTSDKSANLVTLLSNPLVEKALIFSEYDHMYQDIPNRVLDMSFMNFKGNPNTIAKNKDRYKRPGQRTTMFLTSNYFGCGLNLECTTDVILFHKQVNALEDQIIGLAQRPGRTAPLRVWYLLHKNEVSLTV